MSCTATLIITTFKRPHLLEWGLKSLARQALPAGFETIVLNDGINDETETICNYYQQHLNLRYIFTGHRNLSGRIKWRVPGFAINIGAKMAKGDILIISCAEMFHLNDSVAQLISPLMFNPKLLGIPVARDDQDGTFLNNLIASNGEFDWNMFYNYYPELNNRLPFFLALSRNEFFVIGGYDEDFSGIGYDDNDLMSRLLNNGCQYYQTAAATIHLYHERIWFDKIDSPEVIYNRTLFCQRQGQVVRNQSREWGQMPTL